MGKRGQAASLGALIIGAFFTGASGHPAADDGYARRYVEHRSLDLGDPEIRLQLQSLYHEFFIRALPICYPIYEELNSIYKYLIKGLPRIFLREQNKFLKDTV